MDAWFIWCLIFLALTLLAMFIRSKAKDPGEYSVPRPEIGGYTMDRWVRGQEEHEKSRENMQIFRSFMKGVVGTLGFLTAFFLIMSSFVIVGTNQVGIMTSFSKPQTAHSNGFSTKLPWEIKTEFDGARQFLRFGPGEGNNEEDLDKKVFPCIQVKLDGQPPACITGVVAWQMKADTKEEKANAVELFKTYRAFERMTQNFVLGSTRKAMGQVFSLHNPLIDEKNQTLSKLNEMAKAQLITEFTGELTIQAVDLQVPDYDPKTDEAIAAVNAQRAKTQLAKEELLTNQAKSAANAALEASVQNPAVNVANCIQAAIQLNREPGFCLMGSGSVMVNTSGQQK